MEKNTETVFGAAGRTLVQSVAGTLKGVDNELSRTDKIDENYTEVEHTSDGLPEDVSVSRVRTHRNGNVEAYVTISQGSSYNIMLDALDAEGNVIIALDKQLTRGKEDRKTLAVVNFSPSKEDIRLINKVVKYNVSAKQLKFEAPLEDN